MLASSIPSGIRLDVDVQPGLPAVRISAVDVHQIVMNLVINARDAIGEHGRIQVRLLEDSLDNQACAACGKGVSGPHVVLEVSDDGSGIPESVLPRIFDPFFTTKGVGKGTGLGLASVLGIVHNAGGHIQAGPAQPGPVGLPHPGAPAPRRGTRMRVLLPAQADFAASPDALPSATRPPSFEGASVWVVDDDPVVLIFLGELLQEHGCLVRTFADPRLALEALRTSGAPPVALITDQTMPGLSGAELARVAMQLHPGMGVILCTGYSEHVDEATAQAIGVRHFLRKPFDSHHLLEALRAELRRPPA